VPAQIDKRKTTDDTGYDDRRLARRLQDPEFRAEFERRQREIAAIDGILAQLDGLREKHRMTKAGLARAIDKNPAAVRRLLTASGNPELRTVVAMAQALDAELKVVATQRRKTATQSPRSSGARDLKDAEDDLRASPPPHRFAGAGSTRDANKLKRRVGDASARTDLRGLRARRQEILRSASRHGAHNVRVFGSTARGTSEADSDLDLLVEMEPGRSLLDLVAFWQELEDLLGIHVDVLSEGGVSPHLRERIHAEAVPL
jgi:uncharacterized protein